MGWIDVHTHLEMLKPSPDETLRVAREAGVERMITIACHPKDNEQVLALAHKYFPIVGAALGVHPHEAIHFNDEVETQIQENLNERSVVAVGEIGLDFHYDHSPREIQKKVFRRQLEIASEFVMPVQIHTRDAEADTIEILKDFPGLRGMIHCFTGTPWLAEQALNIGFNISFSGIITFKNAENLRDVVRSTPLNRLHVETDAPFLTPAPHRGIENAPSLLIHTAKKIAELKGVSEPELQYQVMVNATTLFPKLN